MASSEDYVNHPSHYTYGNKECIDVIRESLTDSEYAGYLKGTQIKYIFRHEHKWNPIEDLKKASWYLDRFTKDCKWLIKDYAQHLFVSTGDGDVAALIDRYISAIGSNDVLDSSIILNELLVHQEAKETSMNDISVENNTATSDKTDPEVLELLQDGFSIATPDDISIDPMPNTESHSEEILAGMKFLAERDSDLWDYSYSFNYDPYTNTLKIRTFVPNTNDVRVFGEGDLTPVVVTLKYFTHKRWNLSIETEN